MNSRNIEGTVALTLTFSMEFTLDERSSQGTQWHQLCQLIHSKTGIISPGELNIVKEMIKPQLNHLTIEQILANVSGLDVEYTDTVFKDFQIGPAPKFKDTHHED